MKRYDLNPEITMREVSVLKIIVYGKSGRNYFG